MAKEWRSRCGVTTGNLGSHRTRTRSEVRVKTVFQSVNGPPSARAASRHDPPSGADQPAPLGRRQRVPPDPDPVDPGALGVGCADLQRLTGPPARPPRRAAHVSGPLQRPLATGAGTGNGTGKLP